jgi:hypothetical protein
MLQKLAPLIILAMFLGAAYVITIGMNQADELVHPKKTERPNP